MTDSPTPRPARRRRLKAAGVGFIPVPTARNRDDGWTPERQQLFLAALYACGVVAVAAKTVGMTVQSAYRLRRRAGGESFANAWGRLLREARARALDEAMAQALAPGFVPRRYRGLFVGKVTANNERMVLAALRASSVAQNRLAGAASGGRNAQSPSG